MCVCFVENEEKSYVWLNPLILTSAKGRRTILNVLSKSIFGKIFEVEIFIITQPITLLLMFCKKILIIKVVEL